MGKEVGRRLDQVAAGRQVERRNRAPGAQHRCRAEGEQRLACTYLARVEPQLRARGVVGGEPPGRDRHGVVGGRSGPRRRHGEHNDPLDLGARQRPRAQQQRPVEAGDDGRFEPHRRRPAVDDQLDVPAEVGEHVLRRRRRDMAGAVRRRRHHRVAEGREDLAREAMAGDAHGDAVEAGGGELGDRAIFAPRQHQGQRPRPERRRQPLGGLIEVPERPRRGGVGEVRDQRVERGAALGLIEARHRRAVPSVGAQPIDGLGREREQAAGGERARGPLDCRAAGCDDLCRPSGHSATCQESVRSPCLRPWGEVVIRPVIRRSVAQSGSAPRSGRGGRRFKSCHSDQLSPSSNPLRRQLWRQKRVAEATHNDDWRRWPDEDERTGRRLAPPPVILGE